jgi:hypothetical protein
MASTAPLDHKYFRTIQGTFYYITQQLNIFVLSITARLFGGFNDNALPQDLTGLQHGECSIILVPIDMDTVIRTPL